MLRRPAARPFQTQRDGNRGPDSVVPGGLLGRRRLAPLGAGALHAPRRQLELGGVEHLDPEGVDQRAGVLAERREEHLGRRPPGEPPARLGVDLRHHERGVRAVEAVEGDPPPLGQNLPDLDVVLLAAALLVGAARVAVVQARLAGKLAEQRGDRALVGELGPVVGDDQAEGPPHAGLAERGAHEPQPREHRGARAVGHGYRQLEARGPVVEREQPRRVALPPLDGVHLPGAGALVLGQPPELVVRPAGLVPTAGPSRRRPPPRPVADLPPKLHVGHLGVPGVRPAVYRGRGKPQVGPRGRDLLGRQPAPQPVAYRLELGRGAGLGLVYAAPGFGELGVGRALRHPSVVEDARPPVAPVAPVPGAPVAAPRPRRRARARRRELPVLGRGLAAQRAWRRHEPVPPHLVGDRRGRAAELPGDLAAPLPPVEHPPYGLPLVFREPRVGPFRWFSPRHLGLLVVRGRPIRPPTRRDYPPNPSIRVSLGLEAFR